MADLSALKYWSELKNSGYGVLKRYVKEVGLALPSHVTKSTLLKLIKKEGKFLEDPQEAVTEVKGASASSIEYSKELSRRESASGFNEMEFLRSRGQNKAAKLAVIRFGEHLGSKRYSQVLFNTLAYLEITPDQLEQAVLNADTELLGNELIQRLNDQIFPDLAWNAAVNDDYELGDADEKYMRFFRYVNIPNVRERIAGMHRLLNLRKNLADHHMFSHHVHVGLTNLLEDEGKIKYMTAALLFFRARDLKINLASRQIPWGKDTEDMVLLRWLMEQMSFHSSAQIKFIAKNFDRIFEDEKVGESTGGFKSCASIMTDFIKTQSNTEEVLETSLEFEEVEPVSPGPGNALLTELRTRTSLVEATDFAALAEIERRKQLERKPRLMKKASEHISFCLPVYATREVRNALNDSRNFIVNNHLDSHLNFLEEMETSFGRLLDTTQAISTLWEDCERTWFEHHRTEYMRQIGDPEFEVVFDIVEGWGLFLPDTVWGHIWEYRAPFEQKVDLRFALEVHQEFGAVFDERQ